MDPMPADENGLSCPRSAGPAVDPVRALALPTEKVSILLVDDEPANLDALEAILGDLDESLVRADSGREALRRLLKQDFAVILMDVRMPGMDGFETAVLIRERQRSTYTPIIFLTAAFADETHAARGYSLGGVDYIVKPFEPDILRSKVAVFVELARKTEIVRRQSELLRSVEKREHEKELVGTRAAFLADLERKNEELERNQRILEEKVRELARANEDLEQFAYVASHDLQEPLRMVSSYMQLLSRRMQGRLDKDAEEFIEFARDGAARMRGLIEGLLDYSRAGTRARELEQVDCETVLEQVMIDLSAALQESGAEVTRDRLPTVPGNAIQIATLFQNLIGNAVKFRGAERPRVHVGVEAKDTEWLLMVRDNGIGIEPRHLERIFVIFQRLHTRDQYPGTGIGLAICKKIVERHGGRIWAESSPGRGTTFKFTLPRQGESPGPEQAAGAAAS
ncbi:MAG: hybrid sensor histidine kinase/response regulator [Acidobacteria bacterium]|nr:MAG: hybrid sensor histidine kinase/response regulator [Acidobacteriota bacterium]